MKRPTARTLVFGSLGTVFGGFALLYAALQFSTGTVTTCASDGFKTPVCTQK